MFDVAVVGFGPTGAVLASLLGQAGVRTLVLDKSTAIYDRPRAFALDHEVMRVFQNLGVAGEVAPHTAPFTASEYYGVQGQLIKRLGSVPPPFPLGWPPNMVFNQPAVEAVLRQCAASFESVRIRLGEEVRDVEKIEARFVVGCDGASSTVRQQLGIEYQDLEFDEPWLVVDLLVSDEGAARLPKVSVQYCEPARPCTYLIGPGAHRRWEIMLLPGEDPAAMERDLWRLLARWLEPHQAQLWRVASYRFHALVAREWRRGRYFLAGDAAHQQPPFTGQGMCQGVRDAANLAWKLVHALKASPKVLDSYEVERKRHVEKLTSTIKDIGRVICERDPAKAAARDAKLLAEAGGEIRTQPRQGLIPPLEAGFLSALRHPANGTLFPQPRLKDGRLLDEAAGTGFRAFTKDSFGEKGVFAEAQDVARAWFERNSCTAALVRPDHYVYGVAASEDELARQRANLEGALQ